jgi:hypothetical protein
MRPNVLLTSALQVIDKGVRNRFRGQVLFLGQGLLAKTVPDTLVGGDRQQRTHQ